MDLLIPMTALNSLLPLLAIISGIFVISTKNAIISVFNLIILYILVAFYLIYIGVTYLGISYIIIYIGAIAILFLFIIMMIDIEVVEKRSNNYLPLLFLLLSGFVLSLKKIFYNIGLIKMKSLTFKKELILIDNTNGKLFNINNFYSSIGEVDYDRKYNNFLNEDKDKDFALFMNMNNIYNKDERNFDNKYRFDSFLKDSGNKECYNIYFDDILSNKIKKSTELKGDLYKSEQ